MGIISNLAIIGFFLIALVIAFSIFEPAFAGLFDSATGFFTATQLQPRVGADEIICDLRIKTLADLDQTLPFSTIFTRIDPNNSHEWNYFECEFASQFPLGSLLDIEDRFREFQLQVLDIVTFGGETISVEIVLLDANDPTQKVDAFTQPQMRQQILLSTEFAILPTPFNVDQVFVVKNIPVREYQLQIFYGREIVVGEPFAGISLGAGEPFITKICDQFSVLQGTQCIRTLG